MTEKEKKEICDKCDVTYVCDYKSMPDCDDIQEKEIEEISNIISDNIEFYDVGGGSVSIDEDKVAKTLYNAGYHKTVWHKVTDGDLPKKDTQYLCVIEVANFRFYKILGFHNNAFHMYDNEYGEFTTINEVIAWIELPEYKEIKQ